MKKFTKIFLIIIGTLFVLLGIIGLFVPVMPTTIFLMIAGLCYINSSKRLYESLIKMRYFGPTIKSYVEYREVTKEFKISSLLFMYIPSIITQIFIVKTWIYRVIPLVLIIFLTWHILSLKTVDNETINSRSEQQDSEKKS
ncbi:MAG: DUF454 domain-containing protein [Bacilli bacterium]|nr:DUF454 domain-containing protein [Bacilli bacterium]